MHSRIIFAAATCICALSCRQEARPGADDTQGQTQLPMLSSAEIPPLSSFEKERATYVLQRLSEIPHINRSIDDLEREASTAHGRRQEDLRSILPDIQASRTHFEQDLQRAESAGPAEFADLKTKIDDAHEQLQIALRGGSQ